MQKRRSEPHQRLEFSVVIPCLNEIRTLPSCIKRAQAFLKASRLRGEIIVGDNGSNDGSQAAAEKLGAKVIDVRVRGYGAALHAACQAARGKYIIMGDADDSYHFDEILPFVEPLRNGADLVMGNRFAGGISRGAMPWKNRYIGNPVLSFIGRLFFSIPVRDFHCGLRAFSKTAFERMELRTTGMEFASEMVIKASLRKMRIAEVPVRLYKDGRDRPPHLRPWRDGWRHLRFMLLYSPRWLFLYPGICLMTGGLLLGSFVFPQMRQVGSVHLDIHTLLYAAAMVILGFQAMMYSYLAKSFAIREGLLGEDKLTRFFDKFFTLEIGLVIGILAFVLGLAIAMIELQQWSKISFGALSVGATMRNVILSVVLLILGLEIILFGFFGSLLRLQTRSKL